MELERLNKYILATDLDGTFLHGSSEEKEFFYNFLKDNKEKISVIFVTGRTVGLVQQLYESDFNFTPDYIIADHGAIVMSGENYHPVNQLQSDIIAQWEALDHQALVNLLHDDGDVTKQPHETTYRHAYYYQSECIKERLVPKIEELGFECILSSGVYLDILPKGVNKGQTLLNLLKHLEIDNDNVITAGDSLNDLPLFATGLKSIAVGNAENGLMHHIEKMQNVFLSEYHGIQGIIDGLCSYQWLKAAT